MGYNGGWSFGIRVMTGRVFIILIFNIPVNNSVGCKISKSITGTGCEKYFSILTRLLPTGRSVSDSIVKLPFVFYKLLIIKRIRGPYNSSLRFITNCLVTGCTLAKAGSNPYQQESPKG